MNINHLLVPLDFSESSKNALKAAIGIAQRAGAKITLVNAIHLHTPIPHLKGATFIEAVLADHEQKIKEAFEGLESEFVELKNVPHESDRFVAYLMDAVYTETHTRDIDLIVMGTRAEKSPGERLVGSNATEIIRTSEVPVLVIPENYEGFNPKRIGFASDFLKVPDYLPLEILKCMAELYQSEVMIFHIADGINEEKQAEINRMKKSLSSLENISIRIVAADSVVKGIQEFSQSHGLDLLVLMPRRHNLFERIFTKSISKAVAMDIDIPLLTFHE